LDVLEPVVGYLVEVLRRFRAVDHWDERKEGKGRRLVTYQHHSQIAWHAASTVS
jgi:predicted transcriptional regulator